MIPSRLTAPAPGWTTDADVVIVGTGIAGLTAALRLYGQVERILVVTKDVLGAGSTQWAQGGIAAALGPGDTPAQHERDTLVAGAGACDPEAVRILVTEGPDAVRELISWGAVFDQHDGVLSLTREGGHHRDRIAHAGGDATGAEIQRALIAAVERAPEIEVVQHALAVDLLLDDDGVAGLTLHVLGEGQRDGVGAVRCRAVVLASGGLGQVFAQSTNPPVSTGDGMAVALRAGARLRDVEFVQFHPTVMWLGPDSQGQQPLISEAVRGEGAFLVDWEGHRIMQGVHPLADLAPRDVVAKAITRRMRETGRPHMWLDARHLAGASGDRAASAASVPALGDRAASAASVPALGDRAASAASVPALGDRAASAASVPALGDRAASAASVSRFWATRFPTILATCRAYGVDPVTDLIPVAPAQHYASGGVVTDVFGRTDVRGLYATGEVACSGVHGANRLASNSLLEGLVFSRRIAEVLPGELREWPAPAGDLDADPRKPALLAADLRPDLQRLMTEDVAVLRSAAGLARATAALDDLAVESGGPVGPDAWENSNLVTVSTVLAAAAAAREETRGSHWREDFPERDDERWSGHFDALLVDGAVDVTFRPAPPSDGPTA